MSSRSIPIIDLFAGPGGLGEGFSRIRDQKQERAFEIKLSIEKDSFAHRTLTLRAFFRQFPEGKAPDEYYAYLRQEISRETLFASYPEKADAAQNEAQQLTLGEDPGISEMIGERLSGAKEWVLIGGPPCQAYSLVGRSRMLGAGSQQEGETEEQFRGRHAVKQERFAKDHRHHLYREYLKIIADHRPSIFVMENVKGILSAKVDGDLIFPRILQDLRDPLKALNQSGKDLRYRIYSLVKPADLSG